MYHFLLIYFTLAGTINFKILKRTADFNLNSQDSHSSPALQGKPLPLPKRSKLFLEQSMREKQNPIGTSVYLLFRIHLFDLIF